MLTGLWRNGGRSFWWRLFYFALTVAPLTAARGATLTWSGGGSLNWSDGTDWQGGVAPSGTTSYDLIFGTLATERTTANDVSGLQIDSITFAASGYNLSEDAITLGSSLAGSGSVTMNTSNTDCAITFNMQLGGLAGNTQTFMVSSSSSELTVSGQLTGTARLSKAGVGTLVLSGDNDNYTGTISVSAGILEVTNTHALGDSTSGPNIATNAQLQVVNLSGPVNENLTLNGFGIANDGALLTTAGNNTWAGNVLLASNAAIGASANSSLNIAGPISDMSGQSLTKEGAGQVILSRSGGNTYRGQTTINNGMLTIEDPLSLGSSSGTVVNASALGSGGLQILDPSGVGFTVLNEPLTLNGAGPTGLGALANAMGNSNWAGSVLLGSNSAFPVSIGAAVNTTLTISGVISESTAGTSLTKVDAGTLILSNTNTYTGPTAIKAGVLIVSGSIASSAVMVGDAANPVTSAVLTGDGQVGAVTVGATANNSGAAVEPGNGAASVSGGIVTGSGVTGVLSTGAFTLTSGAHLSIQLGGTTAGAGYDQINATSLSLAGDLQGSLINGFAPVTGIFFIAVQSGAGAAGAFSNAPQGAILSFGGESFEITYQANWTGSDATSTLTGGNDVALFVVPETSSGALALCGLGVLCLLCRRRRPVRLVGF